MTARGSGSWTYHEFALAFEVAIANSDKRVVLFAFAERRAVDVCCKKADGGKDASIEGRLSVHSR